jgi:hypothetical protein
MESAWAASGAFTNWTTTATHSGGKPPREYQRRPSATLRLCAGQPLFFMN